MWRRHFDEPAGDSQAGELLSTDSCEEFVAVGIVSWVLEGDSHSRQSVCLMM